MTAPVFVDTNVLVYRVDSREADKQQRADQWLAFLWECRRGRLSFQVLQEFYATVTRKLHPGLTVAEARPMVRALRAWNPTPVDQRIVEGAWIIEDRFGLSWWDALIVAAAQTTGCSTLLTEDLQHGQDLDGITIVSPFEALPADLGS